MANRNTNIPLSVEALCNVQIIMGQTTQRSEAETQEQMKYCILRNAAKNFFSLEDRALPLSEIQKMSQDAEALCNGMIAMNFPQETETHKVEVLRKCYLDTITKKLQNNQ